MAGVTVNNYSKVELHIRTYKTDDRFYAVPSMQYRVGPGQKSIVVNAPTFGGGLFGETGDFQIQVFANPPAHYPRGGILNWGPVHPCSAFPISTLNPSTSVPFFPTSNRPLLCGAACLAPPRSLSYMSIRVLFQRFILASFPGKAMVSLQVIHFSDLTVLWFSGLQIGHLVSDPLGQRKSSAEGYLSVMSTYVHSWLCTTSCIPMLKEREWLMGGFLH
jgi:hypothetical protein